MKMNHQGKYVACVAGTTALAMILAFSMPYSVNEELAVFLFGGPLFVYFGLARAFRGGELFNVVLFGVVCAGYLAVLLAPLYSIFRSNKRSLVIVQAGFVTSHFLIGLALVM